MTDYKSFYYLMSQLPGLENVKPAFITPPTALRFDELYSPREGTVLIGKSEKHYWRTRDRIQFQFYANRTNQVVFITCINMDNKEIYRTIFLDAEVLYFEVECKAQEGNRTKMARKREKRLFSDEMLHRAVVEYIRARLFITNDLLLWPDFSAPTATPTTQDALKNAEDPSHGGRSPRSVEHGAELSLPLPDADVDTEGGPAKPIQYFEKQVTFNKLSNDQYGDNLEINKPENLSLEGIQHHHILPNDWRPPSPPKPVEVIVEAAPSPEKKSILPRKSSKYNNNRRPSGAIPTLVLNSASTPTLSPKAPSSSSVPAGVPPVSTHQPAPMAAAPSAPAKKMQDMSLKSVSADAAAPHQPVHVNLSSVSMDTGADLTPLATTSPSLNALAPDHAPISSSDKARQVVAVTKVKYPPLIKGHSTVNKAPLGRQTSILKQKPVVKAQVPAVIAGTVTMPSTPAAPAIGTSLEAAPMVPSAEKKKKASPLALAGARAASLLASASKKTSNKVVPV